MWAHSRLDRVLNPSGADRPLVTKPSGALDNPSGVHHPSKGSENTARYTFLYMHNKHVQEITLCVLSGVVV